MVTDHQHVDMVCAVDQMKKDVTHGHIHYEPITLTPTVKETGILLVFE